jgi:hypothetical protein
MESIVAALADSLTLNVFNISEVMKTAYTPITTISFVLLLIFFMAGVMQAQIDDLSREQAEGTAEVMKVGLLALIALLFYKTLFFTVISFFQVLADSVFNISVSKSWSILLQEFAVKNETSALGKLAYMATGGGIGVILAGIGMTLGSIIEWVLLLLRYTILCILYILGPIVIALAPWKSARKLTTSWFKTLFEFGAWLVVMRLIQTAFFGLGTYILFDEASGAPAALVSLITIVYVLVMIMSYSITTKIMSGENMGTVMSAAAAAGASLLSSGAAGPVGGMASKALGGIGSKLSSKGGAVGAIGGAMTSVSKHLGGNSSIGRSSDQKPPPPQQPKR